MCTEEAQDASLTEMTREGAIQSRTGHGEHLEWRGTFSQSAVQNGVGRQLDEQSLPPYARRPFLDTP